MFSDWKVGARMAFLSISILYNVVPSFLFKKEFWLTRIICTALRSTVLYFNTCIQHKVFKPGHEHNRHFLVFSPCFVPMSSSLPAFHTEKNTWRWAAVIPLCCVTPELVILYFWCPLPNLPSLSLAITKHLLKLPHEWEHTAFFFLFRACFTTMTFGSIHFAPNDRISFFMAE